MNGKRDPCFHLETSFKPQRWKEFPLLPTQNWKILTACVNAVIIIRAKLVRVWLARLGKVRERLVVAKGFSDLKRVPFLFKS